MADLLDKVTTEMQNHEEPDTKLFAEHLLAANLKYIYDRIEQKRYFKISGKDLPLAIRDVVLFLTGLMNRSKQTDYFNKYNHILIKMIYLQYQQQNSSYNEMIQHGITLHEGLTDFKNKTLVEYENGSLKWINEVMSKCGVIAAGAACTKAYADEYRCQETGISVSQS